VERLYREMVRRLEAGEALSAIDLPAGE